MPRYQAGDRVRVGDGDPVAAPPAYILGKEATVEVVLDAAAPEGDGVQRYRVRLDRFPDDAYQEGMRRHHNVAEDWLEPAS